MTRNQLEYWKNQEVERHNRVLESQGLESLVIQRRANEISAANIAETERSNRARELENFRSNLAREANEALRTQELIRSNKANENIGMANVGARYAEIGVQQTNANTNYSNLLENIRHNQAVESYQSNANPWMSIATTMDQIWNRVNQPGYVSSVVTTVREAINKTAQQYKTNKAAKAQQRLLNKAAKAQQRLATYDKAIEQYRSGIVQPPSLQKTKTPSATSARPRTTGIAR